jgi:hypothetical protein
LAVEDLRKALLGKAKKLREWRDEYMRTDSMLSDDPVFVRVEDVEMFLVELFREKVIVPRKQLSDIVVGHCSGYYHCNRSSYDELKELLEASDSLSPEEIKDVAIAEKEFASGKCKTFKTADEMIADLHKKHQELSGYLSSPREGIKKRKEATQK